MRKTIENLQAALQRAMAIRPKIGGFSYFAEALRQADVTRNLWSLPSCQSIFLTKEGPVVMQGASLVSCTADVPRLTGRRLLRLYALTRPERARPESSMAYFLLTNYSRSHRPAAQNRFPGGGCAETDAPDGQGRAGAVGRHHCAEDRDQDSKVRIGANANDTVRNAKRAESRP